jgi:homoserine dehydrogenase
MGNSRISFDEALKKAQEYGYAEKNPTADIEGHDTCRKIAILASVASGDFIDYHNIYTEGITRITDRDITYAEVINCKIKLIAMAKRADDGSLELRVAPAMVPLENPLNIANDVFNAILIEGNALGPAMFYGRGAGKLATASAVLADVIEAALHIHLTPHKVLMNRTDAIKIRKHEDCPVKAFLRLTSDADARELLDGLKKITDVTILPEKFEGETALLFGQEIKITEGMVSNLFRQALLSEDSSDMPSCCLSLIRLL